MNLNISVKKNANRFLAACILGYLFLLLTVNASAQNVAINTDGSKANPNAIVDIKSSTKGLLIPRMPSASRLLIPQTNGLLVYDTNTKSFWYSNGETWQNMALTVASTDAWLLGGNAGTIDSTHFLGTTDNVPFNVRVNNLRSGRIDPTKDNTLWGFRAGEAVGTLPFNTSIANTAIGSRALFSSSLGNANTATGAFVLQNNTFGSHNTASGYLALNANIGGSLNTSTGSGSMRKNTLGSNNSAYGATALESITTGDNNTATGFHSMGYFSSGSYNVAYGAFSLDGLFNSNAANFDNTAIGSHAMQLNNSGNGNAALGRNALMSSQSGDHNTAIGMQSLFSSNGASENTAVGFQSLFSNFRGIQNTAIGTYSMYANVSGGDNTSLGYRSLSSSISGIRNTAIGARTMANNTTGNHNTATGADALPSNTSGRSNTATGSSAMFSNTVGAENTADGGASLFKNTGGNSNTAVGTSALFDNTVGSFNTAVGHSSMGNNNTGSFNTAIGYQANVVPGLLVNATVIGSLAFVNASNKVRIGNSAVTVIEGQVPFTTPSDGRYKFQVKEDVKGLDFILALRPVTYQFDVNRFDNRSASADEQSQILQASYDEAAKIRRTGFIAQEVEDAAIKSGFNFSGIIKPKTSEDHYGLSYESFVVPLVKGMQEQQQLIETQNKKIELLMQQVNEMKKKLDALTK